MIFADAVRQSPFHAPHCHNAQSIAALIARKRAEQTSDIIRGWLREELGSECPIADEDIVTVAIARGYSGVRLVPPTGDIETLALQRGGKTLRSIGVRKHFYP